MICSSLSIVPIYAILRAVLSWGEENIRDFGIRGDFGNSWGFIWDFFLIFGISGILALTMLAHVSRCARLVELQLGGKALVKTYSKVADRYVNLLNYSQSK